MCSSYTEQPSGQHTRKGNQKCMIYNTQLGHAVHAVILLICYKQEVGSVWGNPYDFLLASFLPRLHLAVFTIISLSIYIQHM